MLLSAVFLFFALSACSQNAGIPFYGLNFDDSPELVTSTLSKIKGFVKDTELLDGNTISFKYKKGDTSIFLYFQDKKLDQINYQFIGSKQFEPVFLQLKDNLGYPSFYKPDENLIEWKTRDYWARLRRYPDRDSTHLWIAGGESYRSLEESFRRLNEVFD
jgi:hypothetical protein